MSVKSATRDKIELSYRSVVITQSRKNSLHNRRVVIDEITIARLGGTYIAEGMPQQCFLTWKYPYVW